MTSSKVERIIRSIHKLKPLSTSVTRVLRAIDDESSSAGMISDLIGLDPALAANVLQFANSASLGYGPSCSTLSEAVMRLGLRRIRTIVLGVAAAGSLSASLHGYGLRAGELWNHSVAAATINQWLAQRFSFPNPEEVYIAGLLHDIGKIVLDQFMLIDYQQIYYMVKYKNCLLWQAEEAVIGIDHPRAGGLMAEHWNFPESLVEAIRYHHSPSLAFNNPKLAAIVNLANAFAARSGTGLTFTASRVIHPEALPILGLNERSLQFLEEDLKKYFHNESGILSEQ